MKINIPYVSYDVCPNTSTVKRYPLNEIKARLMKLEKIIDKNIIQTTCYKYLYLYNEEYALNRAYYDLKHRFMRYKIDNFGKYFVVPFDSHSDVNSIDYNSTSNSYKISSSGSVSTWSDSSGVISFPTTTTIDYEWSTTWLR